MVDKPVSSITIRFGEEYAKKFATGGKLSAGEEKTLLKVLKYKTDKSLTLNPNEIKALSAYSLGSTIKEKVDTGKPLSKAEQDILISASQPKAPEPPKDEYPYKLETKQGSFAFKTKAEAEAYAKDLQKLEPKQYYIDTGTSSIPITEAEAKKLTQAQEKSPIQTKLESGLTAAEKKSLETSVFDTGKPLGFIEEKASAIAKVTTPEALKGKDVLERVSLVPAKIGEWALETATETGRLVESLTKPATYKEAANFITKLTPEEKGTVVLGTGQKIVEGAISDPASFIGKSAIGLVAFEGVGRATSIAGKAVKTATKVSLPKSVATGIELAEPKASVSQAGKLTTFATKEEASALKMTPIKRDIISELIFTEKESGVLGEGIVAIKAPGKESLIKVKSFTKEEGDLLKTVTESKAVSKSKLDFLNRQTSKDITLTKVLPDDTRLSLGVGKLADEAKIKNLLGEEVSAERLAVRIGISKELTPTTELKVGKTKTVESLMNMEKRDILDVGSTEKLLEIKKGPTTVQKLYTREKALDITGIKKPSSIQENLGKNIFDDLVKPPTKKAGTPEIELASGLVSKSDTRVGAASEAIRDAAKSFAKVPEKSKLVTDLKPVSLISKTESKIPSVAKPAVSNIPKSIPTVSKSGITAKSILSGAGKLATTTKVGSSNVLSVRPKTSLGTISKQSTKPSQSLALRIKPTAKQSQFLLPASSIKAAQDVSSASALKVAQRQRLSTIQKLATAQKTLVTPRVAQTPVLSRSSIGLPSPRGSYTKTPKKPRFIPLPNLVSGGGKPKKTKEPSFGFGKLGKSFLGTPKRLTFSGRSASGITDVFFSAGRKKVRKSAGVWGWSKKKGRRSLI